MNNDDIVHFKKIETALSNEDFNELREKIASLSADPQERKKKLRKNAISAKSAMMNMIQKLPKYPTPANSEN